MSCDKVQPELVAYHFGTIDPEAGYVGATGQQGTPGTPGQGGGGRPL